MILGLSPVGFKGLRTTVNSAIWAKANFKNRDSINKNQSPLLNVPEKDCFEFSKTSSHTLAVLSEPSFGGFNCSPQGFEPRNLYDIPCASCGKETLLVNQVDAFVRDARGKRGEDLIKVLESKRPYYKQNEKKAVAQMMQHLREFPECNLLQTVQALNVVYLEHLQQSQNGILDKVKKVADANLEPKQAKRINEIVDEAKKEIYNSNGAHFKRKAFLERLERYSRSSGKDFSKVYEVARNLPTSSSSVPAFFVKYSRRSNDEIASRLLLPSIATTEHIIPQSLKGKDRTDNYLVMCADCNSQRSSMPYTEWLRIQPKMKYSFEKYIKEVTERIKIGELGEQYATYPAEVSKVVGIQSSGQITAESENYIEKVKINKDEATKPVKRTPNFENRLKAADKKRVRALERLLALKTRAKALQNDPEYKLIVEYYQLRDLLEGMVSTKAEIENELYDVKSNLHANKERIKKKEIYERELKNPSLKPDARKKTKKHLSKLEEKLAETAAMNLEEKVVELEAKKAIIDEQITSLRASQEQRLELVNLPETIKREQEELAKAEKTPENIEWFEFLRKRRIEIQEKISAVRIDERLRTAEREFEDADIYYQNLLASRPN